MNISFLLYFVCKLIEGKFESENCKMCQAKELGVEDHSFREHV